MKTVLITGCSAGGIGSALAQEFQKRGLHVFATARNVSKMTHLEALPNVTILRLAPTSLASCQAAVEAVKSHTDGTGLDYLVNNAGSTLMMPILDVDIDAAKEMYEINVWGAVRMTQVFAPLLINAKGTIVNIGSIASVLRVPYVGLYAGSKAALTSITDTLRLELAPFNVKCLIVVTGAVQSNVVNAGRDMKLPPASRYLSIEKGIAARARGDDGVARADVNQYAKKVVNDILGGATGQTFRGTHASIASFLSAWLPTFVFDYISTIGTGLSTLKG